MDVDMTIKASDNALALRQTHGYSYFKEILHDRAHNRIRNHRSKRSQHPSDKLFRMMMREEEDIGLCLPKRIRESWLPTEPEAEETAAESFADSS